MTFPSWVLVCKLINKVFSEECCWEWGAHSTAWTLPFASIKQRHALKYLPGKCLYHNTCLALAFRFLLQATCLNPFSRGRSLQSHVWGRKALPDKLWTAAHPLIHHFKHGVYSFNRFLCFGWKSAMQTFVLAKGEQKIPGIAGSGLSPRHRLHFLISQPSWF